jgi:molybdopterin molybdotransferase
MISVAEAQARLFALANPLPSIETPLVQSFGHYLAENIVAKRTQPAANLSAMDGYAIRFADMPGPWQVIGESAAGAPYAASISANQSVRIFTGAHVPAGADTILIQEDATREGNSLFLTGTGPDFDSKHVRKTGTDFKSSDLLLLKGSLLSAGAIALVAMAGFNKVTVRKRLKISIIATGNELAPPGDLCNDTQIPSSNSIMLAAQLSNLPCEIHDYGIVADDLEALKSAFLACADSDIIVTTGGASVGDHDLVQAALRMSGAEIDFWRVAMKPGKPVMAGKLGNAIVLGLPGNPSSAFVTSFLFLLPLTRYLAGAADPLPTTHTLRLASGLAGAGNRAEYLRAYYVGGYVSALNAQDSGLIANLAKANSLIICPAFSPAADTGQMVQIHMLPL